MGKNNNNNNKKGGGQQKQGGGNGGKQVHKAHSKAPHAKGDLRAHQNTQRQGQQIQAKKSYADEAVAPASTSGSISISSSGKPLTALQQKFQKKLEGARFRVINEKLYTTTGASAFEEFQKDPSLFSTYHQGFREQAAQWPYNPLDRIIDWIKKQPRSKVVADIGCGDARLADSVPNKVHSFDLVSQKPTVTACDMAHLPLKDGSVDIAVFCLALMGCNVADFIEEAHRVLRVGGVLKITEVRSRFEEQGSNGVKNFVKFLKRAGFEMAPHNSAEKPDNKMFFEMECTKTDREPFFGDQLEVKACVYKKR